MLTWFDFRNQFYFSLYYLCLYVLSLSAAQSNLETCISWFKVNVWHLYSTLSLSWEEILSMYHLIPITSVIWHYTWLEHFALVLSHHLARDLFDLLFVCWYIIILLLAISTNFFSDYNFSSVFKIVVKFSWGEWSVVPSAAQLL